jgi:hypothetical protein
MEAPVIVTHEMLVTSEPVAADTLVLRDGRRPHGRVASVAGRQLEFEEQTGRHRRVLRVTRDEVVRIELGTGDSTPRPDAASAPVHRAA